MPLGQFDERLLVQAHVWYGNGNTANEVDSLIPSGPGDTRIDILQVSNRDTIDHVVEFSFPGAPFPARAWSVLVPAGTGTGVLPPMDMLAVAMPVGFHYIMVPNGSALQWSSPDVLAADAYLVAYYFGGVV